MNIPIFENTCNIIRNTKTLEDIGFLTDNWTEGNSLLFWDILFDSGKLLFSFDLISSVWSLVISFGKLLIL